MGLSDRAEQFLILFNQTPERWLSRVELSERLNKKRLNPSDVAALEYMVEKGMLDAQQVKIGGVIGYVWIYRARQKSA